MEEHKITYILGAGASFGAFPLVKKVDGKHGDMNLADDIKMLGEHLISIKVTSDQKFNTAIKALADILIDTGKEANKFGNIDTYAKYLYHNGDSKLDSLKQALSFYFTWKQIVRKKFDDRYLHFITSIIDESHKFPQKVKLITWNYDFQIETAAKAYKSINFRQFPFEGNEVDLSRSNGCLLYTSPSPRD